MLRHNFEAASSQGDWLMPFTLNASRLLGSAGWSADELVTLHIAPDGHPGWDDYGIRRFDAPPRNERIGSALYQARSDDGSGVVSLRDPYDVQVTVPARIMAGFGPGMVSLGVHFERLSTGQRVTLLSGRLPIVSVP